MWVIVLIYVAGRTIGKIGGAYVGARLAGSPSVIRKNTGVGLFAQGGVAIGLCIMAQTHLQSIQLTPELTLGDAVVFGVTLSTFFVQLIGPPLLKSVIYRTQEAEKKLTVEQAAQRYTVADVIDNSVSIISAEVPLKIAFEKLQYSPYSVLPVVNKTGRTLGLLSMEQVKTLISDHASWDWMIASDLMIENNQPVYARTRLDEALHYLQQHGTNQAVVIDNRDSKKPVGVLTLQHIEEKLKQVVPDMKELQVSHA
jgi:CBS domain-containing protein